jgi:hypothetical protein
LSLLRVPFGSEEASMPWRNAYAIDASNGSQ